MREELREKIINGMYFNTAVQVLEQMVGKGKVGLRLV